MASAVSGSGTWSANSAAAFFPSIKPQSGTMRATGRPCFSTCTVWPRSTSPRNSPKFLATAVAVACLIVCEIHKSAGEDKGKSLSFLQEGIEAGLLEVVVGREGPWIFSSGINAKLTQSVKEAVYVRMTGPAFGARDCAAADRQKWIVRRIRRAWGIDRLQPRGRTPAMREEEPLPLGHPAENALGVPPKLQHRHGLHQG